ncbi:hypothetical protein HK102_010031 [Quaeritorhiza haematococci]|nr:hypothetical protein HK102_010031 [Quaeritorhiza haematococci]
MQSVNSSSPSSVPPGDLQLLLQTIIVQSFETHLYQNAIFFAERLAAFFPTDDQTAYLLAKAYYLSNKPQVAYQLLLKAQSLPGSRYLFARACYDLNRLSEAEMALLSLIGRSWP